MLLWLAACRHPEDLPGDESPDSASPTDTAGSLPPNVLVILLDDVGNDKISAYGEHPHPGRTPNLDALAAEGVLFRNVWASSTCSPGRGALLTGRHGRRYGLGQADRADEGDYEMPLSEVTLPEMLQGAPHFWSSSLVGKWHLSTYDSPSSLSHPGLQGFGWYHATMGNLNEVLYRGDTLPSYYRWELDENGVIVNIDSYITTHQIDDALARIEEMPEPWFLLLSLNAPHTPLMAAPEALLAADSDLPDDEEWALYHQTLEAADTEIGRLLASVDLADTVVAVTSDNGTPSHATLPPLLPSHAKLTLYEGGVNVPLLVAGPPVAQPGSESDALVHIVDLFPTIAELAGAPVDPGSLDGVSLMPILRGESDTAHDVIYVEEFGPNGDPPHRNDNRAVRDARYKLWLWEGVERLYDLEGRLDDGPNLLEGELTAEQQLARDALAQALDDYALQLQPAR